MEILVVDDDPYILRSLSFVLRKEGFEVDIASDGEEGLQKARDLKPKLMFLDIMMPKLNGFNVCRAMKSDEELKKIYIISLTAKGQDLDKQLMIKEGVNEFMTKPFSPREIIARVRELLQAKNE